MKVRIKNQKFTATGVKIAAHLAVNLKFGAISLRSLRALRLKNEIPNVTNKLSNLKNTLITNGYAFLGKPNVTNKLLRISRYDKTSSRNSAPETMPFSSMEWVRPGVVWPVTVKP